MLAAMLDLDPNFRPIAGPTPWEPDAIPTDEEMLRITLGEYLRRPEKMIRLGVRTIARRRQGDAVRRPADARRHGGPADARSGRVDAAQAAAIAVRRRHRRPPALPPTFAPRTPWNQTITPHRRFAYTTIPLEDAKTIRRAFGCTFNDVVMALCSGALRNYLKHHDCLPKESLIAMVPVSVRSGDETDTYQNRVSALLAELATNERDPVKRLKRVQQSMTIAKGNLAGHPGRDADGLHPVRSPGDRRQGDAHGQPAADRGSDEPAVQPGDLQRARPERTLSTWPAPS